jgi:hypothetical protein
MNESTLMQLKIIVERAVRPVRASTARKRKMREELLAHVTGVFATEAAKPSDERTALKRTELRFGSTKELTGQLQESVPPGDGIHRLLDELWPRPDEPRGRRALRYGAWYSLILIVLMPAWYVWIRLCAWLVRAVQWPTEEPRFFGGPVLLLDVLFFAFSAALLLWVLVRGGRSMAARFHCQKEWESLQIGKEEVAPARTNPA